MTIDTPTSGIDPLLERQIALEDEMISTGKLMYEAALRDARLAKEGLTQFDPENWLMRQAIPQMAAKLRLLLMPRRGNNMRKDVRETLSIVDAFDLSYITIQHLINLLALEELSLQNTAIKLGQRIESYRQFLNFKEQCPAYVAVIQENVKTANLAHQRRVLDHSRANVEMRDKEGNAIVDTKTGKPVKGVKPLVFEEKHAFWVGQKLIEAAIEATGQFELGLLFSNRRALRTIKTCANVREWVEQGHAKRAQMSPQYTPMVHPPVPWSSDSPYSGGYVTNRFNFKTTLVRSRRKELIDELVGTHLDEHVIPALNDIQATRWAINTQVMDVLMALKDSGLPGTFEGELEPQLDPAPWNSDVEYERMVNGTEEQQAIVKAWKNKRAGVYDTWYRTASKRMALYYKLAMADRLKDEEAIYFPHNLDFRGRIYPLPAFLQPQGDDTAKALLCFADAEPLGVHGRFWLAVHGANEYGVDKVAFADRVKWVEENTQRILDCAENPYENLWWTEAEKPWCFLAFVFEWARLIEEGDAQNFKSTLPVGMDGSCNGIQHYSGCLADPVGGSAVNLIPHEKPADVYQQVADRVIPMVQADLNDADEDVRAMAKAWLSAGIDRGIVKRNVMTLPYGATLEGFKAQLREVIRKKDEKLKGKGEEPFLGRVKRFPAASYMAQKSDVAIREVVVKASEAMDVLRKVADIVAHKAGQSLTWTTPSGFRPIQLYKQKKLKRIKTTFGGTRVTLGLKEDKASGKLNRARMANAIAPNLIHSFDASHLTLTVRKCTVVGIRSFALVHDSYGAHAGHIETLQSIIRETFVDMYQTNLIDSFIKEVIQQIPEDIAAELPEAPARGTLDLNSVKSSPYFFA